MQQEQQLFQIGLFQLQEQALRNGLIASLMQKEHHVYFSLITPPLIIGIPSELFLWGATILGMVFLYFGLLFNLKLFLIGTPIVACLLYLLAVIMTKKDVFWFSVIVENTKLYKSFIYLNNKIKYRA